MKQNKPFDKREGVFLPISRKKAINSITITIEKGLLKRKKEDWRSFLRYSGIRMLVQSLYTLCG